MALARSCTALSLTEASCTWYMGIESDVWGHVRYYVQYVHVHVHYTCTCTLHIWQSRVEIEHYSVAYFDCITAFVAL